MMIRPYTLSQAAVLMLIGFLLIYLRAALPNAPTEKRIHTRWMMQALMWGGLNILLTLLLGVMENVQISALAYFRNILGILFWHAIARGVYAMPPLEPFASRHEAMITSWATAVILAGEVGYAAFRFWNFFQTSLFQSRPALLNLHLLLIGAWVIVLMVRKLWQVERDVAASHGVRQLPTHFFRMLISPRNHVSSFYRGFLLVALSLSLMTVGFAFWGQGQPVIPTWLLISLDLLVTLALLFALFAYLSSSLAPTSLEIRVMGAGLTIFLGLISLLGWIVSLTFLIVQLPGVPVAQIVGTQMRVIFFTTPAAYRPVAQMLSDLLLPILWFGVGGSLAFVLIYIAYYRTTLNRSISYIVQGFRQVQQGNLAYRIPEIDWQDDFSQIGISFNQMTASLEQANGELQTYHQHLQDLVEQRTAELRHEMELRRRLELRQGIQEERKRIAQETHDGLLQTLMGIRIRLNRGKRLSQMAAERLQAELEEMATEITHSMQDLRSLIGELNEEILPNGLVTALHDAIARHQRAYPIAINASLDYPPVRLRLNQELNLLRIVQEALANASRHGEATCVDIVLHWSESEGIPPSLHLQIQDNGKGFDPDQVYGDGWGVKNMRRRAEQAGATFSICSRPGEGTAIDLLLPVFPTTPISAAGC
jgi:signal transduction histidine kinase